MHFIHELQQMVIHKVNKVFFYFKSCKLVKVKQSRAKESKIWSPNLINLLL